MGGGTFSQPIRLYRVGKGGGGGFKIMLNLPIYFNISFLTKSRPQILAL